MNLASPADGPSRRSRRGVTLIEMLVVVALVVLMMTILASIFQAATGAMSASRVFTELDNNLRAVDITLRADLENVTARFTPPLDPRLNLGYFEYGENAPSDLQGEDTDDYLAFTVKAPEGQPFTGRVWINPAPNPSGGTYPFNAAAQPVTISSDFAEVIYFLRKGNLYRRVLLIVPERNGSITQQQIVAGTGAALNLNTYQPGMLGNLNASWMAVNDISAHPSTSPGAGTLANGNVPIANSLGDLTNRENRYARSRLGNDFYTRTAGQNPYLGRDGVADDFNFDGIDDYYPTLTWSQVHLEATNGAGTVHNGSTRLLINESSLPGAVSGNPTRLTPPGLPTDLYAFPFTYPGMYSAPERTSVAGGVGWLHGIDYNTTSGIGSYNVGGGGIGQATGVNQGNVNLIANQAPIQEGDSLPSPTTLSTWWGFPTWRETASVNWADPVFTITTGGPFGISLIGQQTLGLQTLDPRNVPNLRNPNFLPPLGSMPPDASYPQLNQYAAQNAYPAPFQSDDAGSLTQNAFTVPAPGIGTSPYAYSAAWDDDLIMTGVRSFDVKAYDPNASVYTNFNGSGLAYTGGYYDLGYASTDLTLRGNANPLLSPPAISGIISMSLAAGGVGPFSFQDGNFNPLGFGHEGRMPPLTGDRRVDPNRPTIRDPTSTSFSNPSTFPNNVGDDDPGGVGIIRLRRVWDSWSTAYTQAPGVDLATGRGAASNNNNNGDDRPVYPSYPPPYPQPLRGIQVQIRVVDPKNEKVKVLTIRQDFSDKL